MSMLVFGIGRRGGDMVEKTAPKVDAVFADIDEADLHARKLPPDNVLALGPAEGAEARRKDPAFAFEATMSREAEINGRLKNRESLLLVAGLGGGTGAGATKALAQLAQKRGVPALGLVTRPFSLEGDKRLRRANAGARAFGETAPFLVFHFFQDLLYPFAHKATKVRELVDVADEFVTEAIKDVVALSAEPQQLTALAQAKAQSGLYGYGLAAEMSKADQALNLALSGPFLGVADLSQTKTLAIVFRSKEPIDEQTKQKVVVKAKAATSKAAKVITTQVIDPGLTEPIHIGLLAAGGFKDPLPQAPAMFVPTAAG